MLNFDVENKMQWLNSWNEDLNKREVALTEEKRKAIPCTYYMYADTSIVELNFRI